MRSDHTFSTNVGDSHHHPMERRGVDRLRIFFWLLLGAAAFYLVLEHRVHLLAGAPWLPFLILAACPLMHVFGHGGHGHHHRDDAMNPPSPPSAHPGAPRDSSDASE